MGFLPQDWAFKNKPTVIITFDDGYKTDYSVAYQKMIKKGLKGTSFLTTNWVGDSDKLSTKEINIMKDKWDFECHTSTHTDLDTLTQAEVEAELQNVNTFFSNNGLDLPVVTACPHNVIDTEAKLGLQNYRDGARIGGGDGFNLYGEMDYYELDSIEMRPSKTLQDFKDYTNQAVNENKALIIFGHEILENPGVYDVDINTFENYIDWLIDQTIQVVTIKEFISKVKQ